MRLLLKVIGEEAFELGHRAQCEFDERGGTIGRNGNCHWSLADPTNTISARHALVAHNGRGFLITDTSTNGTYLNAVDAPIGRGNEAFLTTGDTLYMANYAVAVEVFDEAPQGRGRSESNGLSRPSAAMTAPVNATAARPAAAPAGPSPLSFELPPDAQQRLLDTPGVSAEVPQRAGALRAAFAPPARPMGIDALFGQPDQSPTGHAPRMPSQILPSQILPSQILPSQTAPFGPPPQAAARPPAAAGQVIPEDFLSDLLGPMQPAPARGAALGPLTPVPSVPARRPPADELPQGFDFATLAAPIGALPPVAMPSIPTVRPPVRSDAPDPAARDVPTESVEARPPAKPLSADMVTLRQPGFDQTPAQNASLDPVAVLRRRASSGPAPAARPALAEPVRAVPQPAAAPMPDVPPLRRPAEPLQVRSSAAMPLPGRAPSPSARSSDGDASSSAPGLAAFWTGIGIDARSLGPDQQAELLGELGSVLREALNGIVPVLAARRSLKDALRMEQTQLQGQDNNPLKFLPSGDDVVQALAARKLAGFMPLAEAVRQGFRDIQAHEVAAVVSLQAVVKTMLERFDPASMENQGQAPRLFGRGADKARLWDQFVATHAAMAGKDDETTRKIVNQEFSRAYAEQVRAAAEGERR